MRSRLRATIKWLITGTASLLLIAWIGSSWFFVYWSSAPRPSQDYFALEAGHVLIGRSSQRSWPSGCYVSWESFQCDWQLGWTWDSHNRSVTLPLAPPSVALAWSAVLLWRAESSRRTGLCQRCGYSRTGLAREAVCPECGTPGAAAAPSAAPASVPRAALRAFAAAAATTIGVAWTLALFGPMQGSLATSVLPCPNYLGPVETTGVAHVFGSRGFGYEVGWTRLPHPQTPRWLDPRETVTQNELHLSGLTARTIIPWQYNRPWPSDRRTQGMIVRGWPFPALWSDWASDRILGELRPRSGGFALPGFYADLPFGGRNAVVLPYRPVWWGLLANTAFYWTLFFGAWLVIRHARARIAQAVLRHRPAIQDSPSAPPRRERGESE